jgi:hypothetical protein
VLKVKREISSALNEELRLWYMSNFIQKIFVTDLGSVYLPKEGPRDHSAIFLHRLMKNTKNVIRVRNTLKRD